MWEISKNPAEDLTDSCSLINPENDIGISQPAKFTNFAFELTYFEYSGLLSKSMEYFLLI